MTPQLVHFGESAERQTDSNRLLDLKRVLVDAARHDGLQPSDEVLEHKVVKHFRFGSESDNEVWFGDHSTTLGQIVIR